MPIISEIKSLLRDFSVGQKLLLDKYNTEPQEWKLENKGRSEVCPGNNEVDVDLL